MLIEAAHAAPGDRGGFSLVAYADTDNDGAPDREIARSPYHTAEKAGQWSSFTFTAAEENIFVGMSWAPNPDKVVYYERILWPDEVFPEVMYYQTGPGAATANPVLTNLRITFLEDEPSQSASPR